MLWVSNMHAFSMCEPAEMSSKYARHRRCHSPCDTTGCESMPQAIDHTLVAIVPAEVDILHLLERESHSNDPNVSANTRHTCIHMLVRPHSCKGLQTLPHPHKTPMCVCARCNAAAGYWQSRILLLQCTSIPAIMALNVENEALDYWHRHNVPGAGQHCFNVNTA